MDTYEKVIKNDNYYLSITCYYYLTLDTNKVKNLDNILEKCFDKMDLLQIITSIRTTFKEWKEYTMAIRMSNCNQQSYNDSFVLYNDGILKKYEKKQYTLEEGELNFKYEINKSFDINYFNKTKDFIKKDNPAIGKIITNEISYVSKLATAKELELTDNDKALIEAYELFYNKKIDFTLPDTEKEIQYMVYILRRYNMYFIPPKALVGSFLHHGWVIDSEDVRNWVNDLMPLGNNEIISENLIYEDNNKEIKIIGTELNQYLNQFNENKMEKFREFCEVFTLWFECDEKEVNMIETNIIKEIEKDSICSVDDAKQYLKTLDRAHTKMYQK